MLDNLPVHPSLAQIRIVLVQPAGARNVGSVARVMKNMGLQRLILVDPQCDVRDPEARMMAVHGEDILAQAQTVGSLGAAVADCQQVVGATGRSQAYPSEWQLQMPRHALPPLIADIISAIVFGPEDRGLSNDELALCHHHVMIPADPVYPSLNLAQAVGILAYELRLAALSLSPSGSPTLSPATFRDRPRDPAPHGVMTSFFEHLEAVLLQIGYLQPHTRRRKLSKFRAIFQRATLTLPEVALFRGILRQLSWYHRQDPPP